MCTRAQLSRPPPHLPNVKFITLHSMPTDTLAGKFKFIATDRAVLSPLTPPDRTQVCGMYLAGYRGYDRRDLVGDYSRKHVLITGCDTGFGNLLAKRLDGLGFNVFAACLTSAGAEKLQLSCSERVTTLQLDVTDEESITGARDFVTRKLPEGAGLWGVVNNAGVASGIVPSEWLRRQDYVRCLDVNLFGLIDVTRVFLPLVRRARGRVVNMSSVAGRMATAPGPVPYFISKYGVEAFSDCLRREVYRQGIKVCIIEPGFFKTDILNAEWHTNQFLAAFNATPPDIRQHYRLSSLQAFKASFSKSQTMMNDNPGLVVDAYELALTSRFPPIRQLVGNDARILARVLWNLPTPFTDWIVDRTSD
ncbi:hypothetical protein BaRGS_00013846 [Batillaria attramentaria]|uniref:Uncharacterized protein n=1 Tax=Batillaria attramentaria TaxID=370345 RepID=A0ABD0L723_9CAEN